ncbi:hypothetical protein [Kineosporia succinea]|uniref:Uncharacterized protein n=1 Tax=Kineosporia succinea TaxID=84632 RepID=A0ABT9P4R6_9ACTN|nr:hypothetical protein [Kineosporia succinea]MDP9827679.1 hypothetical protein [Kineosporia succinea]
MLPSLTYRPAINEASPAFAAALPHAIVTQVLLVAVFAAHGVRAYRRLGR